MLTGMPLRPWPCMVGIGVELGIGEKRGAGESLEQLELNCTLPFPDAWKCF